jgi:hypothetical protein
MALFGLNKVLFRFALLAMYANIKVVFVVHVVVANASVIWSINCCLVSWIWNLIWAHGLYRLWFLSLFSVLLLYTTVLHVSACRLMVCCV